MNTDFTPMPALEKQKTVMWIQCCLILGRATKGQNLDLHIRVSTPERALNCTKNYVLFLSKV